MPHTTMDELLELLGNALVIGDDQVVVQDEELLTASVIDELLAATSAPQPAVRETARWTIWAASQALGCGSCSTAGLQAAMGRGDVSGLTVPAFDVGEAPYRNARRIMRIAKEVAAGAIIFDLPQKPQRDTSGPDPVSSILAAAIKEGWAQPVPIRNAAASSASVEDESNLPQRDDPVREAIRRGSFNLRLRRTGAPDAWRDNGERCGRITTVVRGFEPDDVTIAIDSGLGVLPRGSAAITALTEFTEGLLRTAADLRGPSTLLVELAREESFDEKALESLGNAARQRHGLCVGLDGDGCHIPPATLAMLPSLGCQEIGFGPSLFGENPLMNADAGKDSSLEEILFQLGVSDSVDVLRRHIIPVPVRTAKPFSV